MVLSRVKVFISHSQVGEFRLFSGWFEKCPCQFLDSLDFLGPDCFSSEGGIQLF